MSGPPRPTKVACLQTHVAAGAGDRKHVSHTSAKKLHNLEVRNTKHTVTYHVFAHVTMFQYVGLWFLFLLRPLVCVRSVLRVCFLFLPPRCCFVMVVLAFSLLVVGLFLCLSCVCCLVSHLARGEFWIPRELIVHAGSPGP